MARPLSGYATITTPDTALVERDTVNCGHCGAIIFLKPGTASTTFLVVDPRTHQWVEVDGAGCFVCRRPVCLACYDLGICRPLEALLAQLEGRPERRIYAVSG